MFGKRDNKNTRPAAPTGIKDPANKDTNNNPSQTLTREQNERVSELPVANTDTELVTTTAPLQNLDNGRERLQPIKVEIFNDLVEAVDLAGFGKLSETFGKPNAAPACGPPAEACCQPARRRFSYSA